MRASKPLYRIIIVGGGTAGWMTAAALTRFLPVDRFRISLIESEQIGTVGVGEATIPHIRQFNALLGIDENDFIRTTKATYKLGIQFTGWGTESSSYMHPFSTVGCDINGLDFHHFWLKAREAGDVADLDEFSPATVAAHAGRFDYPRENVDIPYGYAFHLDAGRYARSLRDYAEARGANRVEGRVNQVQLDPESGYIESLHLESGQTLAADLFIDCSGFRALLMGEALGVGYDDWSHWLPCDRAVAVPSERQTMPASFTRAAAQSIGWQWRIPLQHRTGNGQVYANAYMTDEQALSALLENLEGEPLAEPNFLRFTAGRRQKSWEKNCIAIGLSSGFLEPLESTSIYLIQVAIMKLLEYFPDRSFAACDAREFNHEMAVEYLRVRDFLILHYKLNQRTDSDFWRDCQAMSIPDELERKIRLFKEAGRLEHYEQGLFIAPSWMTVYLGQGLVPDRYDARLTGYSSAQIQTYLERMRRGIAADVESMPTHSEAIQRALVSRPSRYPVPGFSFYGRVR